MIGISREIRSQDTKGEGSLAGRVHQLTFQDLDSGSTGLATARAAGASVGVGLSLEENGDIEVFLSPASARRLAALIVAAAGEADE